MQKTNTASGTSTQGRTGLKGDGKPQSNESGFKVKISPSWLMAMVPAVWIQAAARLDEIRTSYDVPSEKMELFVGLATSLPVPLVQAVQNFADGTWIIEQEMRKQPDGTEAPHYTIVDGPPKIVLPTPIETARIKRNRP